MSARSDADIVAALSGRGMTPKQLRQKMGMHVHEFPWLRERLAALAADGTLRFNASSDQYVAAKADEIAQQNGVRSSADLREMLFDTIDRLRTGKISANEAKAVANLSDQIVKSALAELEFARASRAGDVDMGRVGRLPLALTKQDDA